MSGYANRVIRIPFDELSTGPDDPIWVIIRNPKLMTTDELTSGIDGAYDDEGNVIDREKATEASRVVLCRLVVAARVYDATVQPTYDQLSGEETSSGAVLLPPTPWDPGVVARLPAAVIRKLSEVQQEALVPKLVPESGTPKTSSGQPSPSTTEPGEAAQPLPS